ncbi:MAG: VOC family protein [Bacteroidales bacterium]
MKHCAIFLLALLALSNCTSPMAKPEFSSGNIDVGVVVKDMDRSMDFYLNVIGMKKVDEFDVTAEFGAESGLTRGLPFHVNVLKLQDNPLANQWKLMSFPDEESTPRSQVIHDDRGVQYVTINVTSLAPILERIKTNQVRMLGKTPIPLNETDHFVLIQDPDGTFIELIGPLD